MFQSESMELPSSLETLGVRVQTLDLKRYPKLKKLIIERYQQPWPNCPEDAVVNFPPSLEEVEASGLPSWPNWVTSLTIDMSYFKPSLLHNLTKLKTLCCKGIETASDYEAVPDGYLASLEVLIFKGKQVVHTVQIILKNYIPVHVKVYLPTKCKLDKEFERNHNITYQNNLN